MTELPPRTSPTRPPYGTNPPLETSPSSPTRSPLLPAEAAVVAAAASTSRPPLPELSLRSDGHFMRTASYLFLAAALVTAGWYLLPHGGNHTEPETAALNQSPEARRLARSQNEAPTASLPALPSTATTYPRDPATDQREAGLRHISTLQLSGSYAEAADYAVAAPLEYRRDFTITAYHEWGRHQPEQAIASAIRIQDNYARDFATHSVLSGWARNDPEGMAETALAFPEGDFKKAALTKALRAWMNKDPNLAGDWIMAHPDAVPVADEMFRKDRR